MTEAPAEAGQPTTPEGEVTPETTSGAEETKVPQSEVSKIAAKEKRDGRKSARTEILERAQQYGVESLDDVFSILEQNKLAQDEMETEADKAAKRAEKAEAAEQAANERYQTTLKEFALRDALRDAGINSERLPLAMRAVREDFQQLTIGKNNSVEGVDEVVTALKEGSPEWFGEQSRPRVNAPQTSGTGIERPNGTDPQQQHANFLASLLNGNP